MNTHPTPLESAAAESDELAGAYAQVRARTVELIAPLSNEDCCVQSMPDASPAKWHLAHTTWFFETFVLERFEADFKPFDAAYRVLFNSYYNGVGDKHPRAQRGLLTRPPLSEVRRYRAQVDARVLNLIRQQNTIALQSLVILGLNHEEQHQELIVTDIKHLLSANPLQPAYIDLPDARFVRASDPQWIAQEGGIVAIGAEPDMFCFDNELPRHEVLLRPWQLASRLVTNAEYLDFVESDCYRDASLWLSEGWEWIRANAISHPIYWTERDGVWGEFTLGGLLPLDPEAPVAHVSYFEADAFARWSDARLPTEAEWENAARACRIDGNFAESGHWHPQVSHRGGLTQMFGDLWEWTSSSYSPYPGYRPAAGAIGEYNGKFMVNQYVLRGGSCATPRDHMRASYRNFFPATTRWQFSGIRLAKDSD